MIDNEELFQQIPKHIKQWTQQDVQKWFKINNIQIESNLKLSGQQFLNLTPNKIFKQLKVSHFLARKISDWIEYQVEDFQQYVNQYETKQNKQKKIQYIQEKQQVNNDKLKQLQKKKQQQQQEQILQQKEFLQQKQLLIYRKPIQGEAIVKYKSEQGIKQKSMQIKQYKSQGNQHVRFQIQQQNQSQQTQFYKPMKYQVNKNWVKKVKNSQNNNNSANVSNIPANNEQFRHKYNIPHNNSLMKKVQRSELVLNQLMQNGQNSSQIQTYKYLPQDSEYYNNQLSSIQSSNNRSNINRMQQVHNIDLLKSSDFYQKNVRLVSSQLILPNFTNILVAYYNDNVYPINKTTKIGRSNKNNMIMQNQGVSRNHAEILVEQQQIQILNQIKKIKKYYLKDVGSKFGTFVNIQSQKPKKIMQNQSYCIGETVIRISKLKIYKNKQKFDITIQHYHNQQSEKVFLNKSQISIGNSSKKLFRDQQNAIQANKYQNISNQQITKRSKQTKTKDLQLGEDSNVKYNHCRFLYLNGDVYFQQVQGTILEKLEANVKMQFTKHKYQVKFGDGNVIFVFQNGYNKIQEHIQ